MMKFDIHDHYFLKAKKEGYLARSAYKLQEIDEKFGLLKGVKTVLDIGCAPGSRTQYVSRRTSGSATIIGMDLKKCMINLPHVYTYVQDITEVDKVRQILSDHTLTQVDCIVSDMAPDTIGHSNTDALRSVALIEETMWLYEEVLKQGGSFAIKVFMGPGYQELYHELRKKFGGPKYVKIFKPKACRKKSKETYIVGISH